MIGVEYLNILFIFMLVLLVAFLLFGVTYYLNPKQFEVEKLSPYECGFDSFSNARVQFNVRFYLVSILFIIFDLEIMFLFPWCLVLQHHSYFEFFTMVYFLGLLTVGFIYEWVSGALDWD